MARARFIRPEFFTDEKVSDLPFGACMLFAGIWCHADLRGVFEYSPRTLRGLIFPMRDGIDTAAVGEWLEQLRLAGMVASFEADGKLWGYVVHWDRYQTVSGSEVKWGSKRPPPPTAGTLPAQCHAQAASLTPSLTLTPTPTCARDPAATAALRKTVRGYNTAKVTDAIQAEDLGALVAAFGGNKRGDEWARDAAGRTIGIIAAVFDFMAHEKRPIREPSGLRKALAEWDAKPSAWRREWARHMAEELGFNVGGTP